MATAPRASACCLWLIVGCDFHPPAPHDDMPEADAPTTLRFEAGPIAEGYLDRAAIEAQLVADDAGHLTTQQFELPGALSRASMLIDMSAGGEVSEVEVRAGWSSGQVGPWIALSEVWTEAQQRVVAADLDTAATRLQFRIDAASVENVRSIWWTANVPLAPDIRSAALPELEPPADSIVSPRAAWMAERASCGEIDLVVDRVTLYRIPAPGPGDDGAAFLRAVQALDREGRHWCDLRASYLVGEDGLWSGRGARRPAYASEGEDVGRIAVAVLGCDAGSTKRSEQLAGLLGELTQRHGLSSPDQFRLGVSSACPSDGGWLGEDLAAWLETDPFDVVVEPPIEGHLSGRVWDASTGDQTTGEALSDAAVICDCGRMTRSDGIGALSIDLPAGTHQITVSKVGYVDATETVAIAAGAEAVLSLGLAPIEPPDPGISAIDHSFLIQLWGGNDVDPATFDETQDGFQQYLDAVGVVHFAASEYVIPNNMQVAQDCGYTILLPERAWWRKAGALGLLADQLRSLVNEPVILRNWWRPPCYNMGVGGADGGDHPDADALDLDFQSARSRADAQRYLCETYWKQDLVAPEDIAPGSNLDPRLNLSIGLGSVTIHLGLLSANGRRYWKYASYEALSDSGDCW